MNLYKNIKIPAVFLDLQHLIKIQASFNEILIFATFEKIDDESKSNDGLNYFTVFNKI